MRVAGLILAGGASRRMGREKSFLLLDGTSLLAHVLQRLAPQCDGVAIASSGDPARFAGFDCPVILDETPQGGPLSGLVTALDWFAGTRPTVTHVLSAASDTPFLPSDLGARLSAALTAQGFCAIASSGGREHPVSGLWPLAARGALRAALAQERRSFHAALEGRDVARVDWPVLPRDPFFNINTPDDLAQAGSG